MTPADFFQKPLRWLQVISKYRATTSGGPNFAYDLCINKITEEEKNGLDLSCWDLAFNGAEPIRFHTMEKTFRKAFKVCGFRAGSFLPVLWSGRSYPLGLRRDKRKNIYLRRLFY